MTYDGYDDEGDLLSKATYHEQTITQRFIGLSPYILIEMKGDDDGHFEMQGLTIKEAIAIQHRSIAALKRTARANRKAARK
ncbi:hypothetical protein [Frigoribacterium sp. UYMn621]|uniref:hypothetical protein n=1 Tax=Frigoribacterium sp. UYMn621 TaxID=3156343 RepID=UPI003397FDBA